MYPSYLAYVKNGQLIPLESGVTFPEGKKLIVTVLDEPIKADEVKGKKSQKQAFADFFDALDEVEDEPI